MWVVGLVGSKWGLGTVSHFLNSTHPALSNTFGWIRLNAFITFESKTLCFVLLLSMLREIMGVACGRGRGF